VSLAQIVELQAWSVADSSFSSISLFFPRLHCSRYSAKTIHMVVHDCIIFRFQSDYFGGIVSVLKLFAATL
jgi:hypothetical protein